MGDAGHEVPTVEIRVLRWSEKAVWIILDHFSVWIFEFVHVWALWVNVKLDCDSCILYYFVVFKVFSTHYTTVTGNNQLWYVLFAADLHPTCFRSDTSRPCSTAAEAAFPRFGGFLWKLWTNGDFMLFLVSLWTLKTARVDVQAEDVKPRCIRYSSIRDSLLPLQCQAKLHQTAVSCKNYWLIELSTNQGITQYSRSFSVWQRKDVVLKWILHSHLRWRGLVL